MIDAPILLLDLGNVVFPLEFDAFDQWLEERMEVSVEEGRQMFMELYLDYEKGAFDTSEFLSKVRLKLKASFEDDEFEKMWISCWVRDTPGIETLIDSLPQSIPVYVLSNTNELHMRNYCKTKAVLKKFQYLFLSYQMKAAKPERKIYQKVVEHLKVAPERIFFFDDKQENIDAANESGMQAFVFENPTQIKEKLGLLI